MLESDIQRDIIKYLESQGYFVFRMNAGKVKYNVKLSFPGTPDLLCLTGEGKLLFIEVKMPGKKLSDIQSKMHLELKKRGYDVIVAYSLEEVITYLSHTCGYT